MMKLVQLHFHFLFEVYHLFFDYLLVVMLLSIKENETKFSSQFIFITHTSCSLSIRKLLFSFNNSETPPSRRCGDGERLFVFYKNKNT